ncbi:MAG: hypothetical protein ACR2IE_13860 [Candidatus Sumerlaeaceae bacterium]
MIIRGFSLAATACLVLLPANYGVAMDAAVGYADSHAGELNRYSWVGSNVFRVRMCVSYNVAQKATTHSERVNFQNMLANASAKGTEVMATLMNDADAPTGPVPLTGQYDTAIADFLGAWPLSSYPQLPIIGSWNEPNFSGKTMPTIAQAAGYYNKLHARTSRTKVAGEWAGPSDSSTGRANLAADINDYFYYLGANRPMPFGYHAWTDVRKMQWSGDYNAVQTKFFRDTISGPTWGYAHLWNTETGAFLKFTSGGVTRTFTQAQQSDAVRFLHRCTTLSTRITRHYHYCFYDGSSEDSGVVNSDSSPRTAYYTVRDRLM